MKISHECPNSIFDKVQNLIDYDYALVHLYLENEEYRNHFLEAKAKGREIILDNSIFELGTAFDPFKYAEVIKELKPTYYIIPDVLENAKETQLNYVKFIDTFKDLPGKRIGVLQGKTYQELVDCYKHFLRFRVDKIGISFDYSYYEKCFPLNMKLEAWMKGRQMFIKQLQEESFFRPEIPIHLLGCSLPQEFKYYQTMEFIDSVDTSNPVVHGLKGVIYEDFGLDKKESQKLFTLINSEVDSEQIENIEYNIQLFKKFCNG